MPAIAGYPGGALWARISTSSPPKKIWIVATSTNGNVTRRVADHLGRLLERGTGGDVNKALGKGDPDLRLALVLGLEFALTRPVTPDLHAADQAAGRIPDGRDREVDLEEAPVRPTLGQLAAPRLAAPKRLVEGRIHLGRIDLAAQEALQGTADRLARLVTGQPFKGRVHRLHVPLPANNDHEVRRLLDRGGQKGPLCLEALPLRDVAHVALQHARRAAR